jgi:hypothetical protein|tara:strand:+ start:80 stop:346 length:267 start_codon:yes stop_codon:yes gene_type:complete
MNTNTGETKMTNRAKVLKSMISNLELQVQDYTNYYENCDNTYRAIFKNEFTEITGQYAKLHAEISKKLRETLVIDKLCDDQKKARSGQ